jgi:hypothetical protein
MRSIKRAVKVEPGEQVSVSLFQPNLSFEYGGANVGVEIDGRIVREPVPLPFLRGADRYWFRSNSTPGFFSRSILSSARLSNTLNAHAHKSAVGQPQTSPVTRFSLFRGTYKNQPYSYLDVYVFREAPVESWSRHWLGYSSHDGVVLPAAELQAAPPEVIAALWQYVECGGSLLIIGPARVPPNWEKTRTTLDGLVSYHPGFGQCLVTQETDIAKWEPEQWRPIALMWEQSARPLQDVQTADNANRRFPVVENLRIPVRSLFVVMLLFSVLIGPVNIYVLTRARRRIWLLWTVPGFSFLTCAGVAGFMLLSEGWQGQARIEGMTILDEAGQRASSVAWLGLYTPLPPGDGLHFHPDTELTPHLLPRPNEYRSTGPPRTIDWTSDQNLRSGWITARVPAHFLVRSNEKRQEHIRVEKEPDGSLSAVNALGSPISALWVADADGKISTATTIPIDGKTALTPTLKQTTGNGARLREAFAQDWLKLVDTLSAKPEEYLRPGCYIAVLDSAPFLQPGISSATHRASRSVVFGVMKPR